MATLGRDAAGTGLVALGEVGIANVPVTVTGTDVLGNVVSRSTTTDANGNWLIDGLLAASAKPAEIADAVAFLAGPDSRFISGQVLRVDGGLSLYA